MTNDLTFKDSEDIMARVIEFMKENPDSYDFESFRSKYSGLSDAKRYTLFKNLVTLQSMVDRHLKSIKKNTEILNRLSSDPYTDKKDLIYYQRNISDSETKIHDYIKTINLALDKQVERETPKNLNVNVTTLDLNSIHQQMRDITPSD